jgi:hypothetical protein
MERERKLAMELQALQALCDPAVPLTERRQLLRTLDRGNFIEPEHQIVFDSIRALLARGPVSEVQLRVHLTNRGFPDTDVERFFSRTAPSSNEPKASGNATP